MDMQLIIKKKWNKYKIQKYSGISNFKQSHIYKIWHKNIRDSMKNMIFTFFMLYYLPHINSLYELADIYKLLLYSFYTETHFYFIHRLFHTKQLYFLHKRHHETSITIAASSLNADFLEHIIINIGPIIISFLLFGGSKLLILFVTIYSTYSGCVSHSGYKKYRATHDLHHQYLKYNFGTGNYIWDKLFNTYKE